MTRPFRDTIHSDNLIHWTGWDIEKKYETDWNPERASINLPNNVVDAYIDRLKNILKFGFWMTTGDGPEEIKVNGNKFPKPKVARTCFTELKLSENRKHAEKYGRLGIGVKRFYVFDRFGGPMHYLKSGTENLFFPPYSSSISTDPELISFYKHMCSDGQLKYDLFSESEWRIIFSENIKKKIQNDCSRRLSRFIDPKKTKDQELLEFYNIQKKKPDYLLPL